ncbi:SigE family RNA polymerase sigma factor [Streptomyces sp. NPDC057910]|uniref:SigE family RNA polymerase sigma factor n=1 Tax=Streptomyces sp. NPDC057910 TaxID=3346278 RepID=UPI0036F186CA
MLGFEDFVRTRQDALLRSARRLIPNHADAQDLLQTALMRTFSRWDAIEDKQCADAYVRRVMINTRTEWWRARKPTEVLAEFPLEVTADESIEQYGNKEDQIVLIESLRDLTKHQQSVVLMRHWGEMSTEETAAALGIPSGTVKSTLHRATVRLREGLTAAS